MGRSIALAAWLATTGLAMGADVPASSRPNVVVILADDLGYGDVRCLNPRGKIATPNLDRLAAAGMTFTDAHSGSSVCTPTRYGLLTGRYSWRSKLKSGVLNGYSPRLIEPGRLTVASLLKRQGYRTACVGKWHLGLNWSLKEKEGEIAHGDADAWRVDYARPFANGPTSVGFDEFFGISASLDMPPYVFLVGDRARSVPTVEKTWIRKGPAAEDFEAVDVLPTLAEKAVAFIDQQAAPARGGSPFFLYLPLAAPHTPIVPSKESQGRSGLTPYGDFVVQVDKAIGRVLEAIDHAKVAEDTLVIVTSDNGCSPMAGIDQLRALGHDPCAGFRGHKADIYEGGHRMPFFVRWPGRVAAGSRSSQVVGLIDVMATLADILGVKLPDDAGEDSVSLLPALLGRDVGPLRESLVHHSVNGAFAIRQGRWKLALCPGSGGWSFPRPGRDSTAGLPHVQLFDLEADLAETTNRQAVHPEIVARMTERLEALAEAGRSTPGSLQKNQGPVDVHSGENPPEPKKAVRKSQTPARPVGSR